MRSKTVTLKMKQWMTHPVLQQVLTLQDHVHQCYALHWHGWGAVAIGNEIYSVVGGMYTHSVAIDWMIMLDSSSIPLTTILLGSHLHKDYLSIMLTSISSEQAFSQGGITITSATIDSKVILLRCSNQMCYLTWSPLSRARAIICGGGGWISNYKESKHWKYIWNGHWYIWK